MHYCRHRESTRVTVNVTHFSHGSLNTEAIENSYKKFALKQKINVPLCSKWAKSRCVETKWSHDVTWSSRRFSLPEIGDFSSLISLSYSFRLRQLGSPLLGLFWLVPGFIEVDQVVNRL
jgi:hypothetical protein